MKEIVKEQGNKLIDPDRSGFHHIGNSTHWIVFEGVKILTDPWLAEPAEHILKHSIPPIPFPNNPNLVLISHEHDDHFDPEALDRLDRDALVLAPIGKVAKYIKKMGFKGVIGVSPGQQINHSDLVIDIVRGKHNVPEVCYRISKNENSFFFGGDTMVTKEIQEMADEKPVPFVILPGEYSRLFGFRFVMTPNEAIELATRFRAEKAVLTHHEQVVAIKSILRFIVSIKKVNESEFPSWFVIPKPGDYVGFPWDTN